MSEGKRETKLVNCKGCGKEVRYITYQEDGLEVEAPESECAEVYGEYVCRTCVPQP
jgi:hypothetical protein